MRKPATRALTVILSFVLTVNMCPTAAFAAATGTQGPEIAEEFDQSATVDESDIDLALYEQPEMPSEHTASEPDGTNADATDSAHGNADDGARAAQTSESSSADGTTSSDNTSKSKNATQAPEASPASAAAYAHTATAEQNGVTFTVEWNDAPAGTATTFHVSQTGGSANAKVRMDVPAYFDGGSQEIVCDPSRGDWKPYHSLGADGHDYTFEFTASGTYRIYVYFLDGDSGIWYLRTAAQIAVSDTTRPSVSRIVNDAVARCRRETDGSEYAMALWLHDWTLDQLEYDRSLNWCSAESGLTRRLGTCESYQRIYAKLLDAAGIANGRIVGNGHTWNAVRIDGKWCQMDLTWDDSSGNWYGDLDQRHLYFGLTDELMAIAHSDHTANYQADDYAYRSTDLSNAYFVRNGKADEWAEAYADRIQQRLDAKETEFSIDADNASFPPSISGIQNALIAYAMNQREWSTADGSVTLTATSNVTVISSHQRSARFDFEVEYPDTPDTPMVHERTIADGEYIIGTALTERSSVDIAGGSHEDRANVRLFTTNYSQGQRFNVSYDEQTGYYTIQNVGSDKMIDVQSGIAANGRNVHQWPANGTKAQQWVITDNGDGTYTLLSAIDESYALDISGGRTADRTNIQIWPTNGMPAQKFTFSRVNDLEDGVYEIGTSLDGGFSLDVKSASSADRANIHLYQSNGTNAQKFYIAYDAAKKAYTIANIDSGKVLDVASGRNENGRNVWQFTKNGTAAQRWVLVRHGDGYVVATDMWYRVLDVAGDGAANYANVQIAGYDGAASQVFKPVKLQ